MSLLDRTTLNASIATFAGIALALLFATGKGVASTGAADAAPASEDPVLIMDRFDLGNGWDANVFATVSGPLLTADGGARPVRSVSYMVTFWSKNHPGTPRIADCRIVDAGSGSPLKANVSIGGSTTGSAGEPANGIHFEVELRPFRSDGTWGQVRSIGVVAVKCRVRGSL